MAKKNDVNLSSAQLSAVKIDDFDLDAEFIDLPAQLAYWNAKYGEANRRYLLARHTLRVTEARLRLLMREEHADDKPKATNDDIIAYVHTHPDYIDAHLEYIDADATALEARKYAEAVSAKKDMLQSLGAKLRAEMQGDPAIRSMHRENRHDRETD